MTNSIDELEDERKHLDIDEDDIDDSSDNEEESDEEVED